MHTLFLLYSSQVDGFPETDEHLSQLYFAVGSLRMNLYLHSLKGKNKPQPTRIHMADLGNMVSSQHTQTLCHRVWCLQTLIQSSAGAKALHEITSLLVPLTKEKLAHQ